MKNIFVSFFSNIGQKLAVLLLIGTTAITTGSAVFKIVVKPNQTSANEKSQVLGDSTTQVTPTEVASESNNPTTSPTITTAPTEVISVTPTPTENVTPTVTATATPTVTAFPSATPTSSFPKATTVNGGGSDDREDSEHEGRYVENQKNKTDKGQTERDSDD